MARNAPVIVDTSIGFGGLMIIFLTCIGLVLSACSGGEPDQPATGATPDVAETVNAVPAQEPSPEIAEYLAGLDADGFNGVILVDDRAGTTIQAFGLANPDAGVPNTPETAFDIGSVTKQFTGAAILRLEMDEIIRLNDPISRYVNGLTDEIGAITIHQLLTHTGGLPTLLGDDYAAVDRESFVGQVITAPLISEPGEEFRYSNVGYSLLGMAIESVTEVSYEEYLREALFQPAGMTQTGYVLPDWDTIPVAHGVDPQSGDVQGRPPELNWAEDGPYWHLRANGGIVSTAGDMLRWQKALEDGLVLDDEALSKLVTPHVPEGPNAESFYGYGWTIVPYGSENDPNMMVFHDGGNGIWAAIHMSFPDEGVTIFTATNSYRPEFEDVAANLAGLTIGSDVAEELFGGSAPAGCEFDRTDQALLDGLAESPTPPNSETGRIAGTFAELLIGGGDREGLARFTADNTADIDAETMQALNEEFAEYELVGFLEKDPNRIHVIMSGVNPDGFDEIAVHTLGFHIDEDPQRISCLGFTFFE